MVASPRPIDSCYCTRRTKRGPLEKAFVEIIIREKIDLGLLPEEEPLKLWAGIGSGSRCTACELPILSSQTEYELLYCDERAPILLHIGCHRIWESQRCRHRYERLPH